MRWGTRLKIVVSPVRVRVSPSPALDTAWTLDSLIGGASLRDTCRQIVCSRSRISAPGLGSWHPNSRHRSCPNACPIPPGRAGVGQGLRRRRPDRAADDDIQVHGSSIADRPQLLEYQRGRPQLRLLGEIGWVRHQAIVAAVRRALGDCDGRIGRHQQRCGSGDAANRDSRRHAVQMVGNRGARRAVIRVSPGCGL